MTIFQPHIAFIIAVFLIINEFVGSNALRSQNRLSQALDDVLGHLRPRRRPFVDIRNLTAHPSKLKRRCFERAACEYPVPPVDATNVAFFNGELHVKTTEQDVQDALQHLSQFYGAKEKHLPSSLVQIGGATDWIAGPKILNSEQHVSACQWNDPDSEANRNNTHAFFLFPWETNNAFHTLNDNVLSVLSNVIVHYLTAPPSVSVQDTPPYTLYVFRIVDRGNPKFNSTVLYDLLPVIFGPDHVLPARKILKGGPHCIKYLSWATANKPVYKDTLVDLRRAAFDVLRHILHSYQRDNQPATISPAISMSTNSSNLVVFSFNNNQSAPAVASTIKVAVGKRQPKVIIITRKGSNDPARKLNSNAELELAAQFTSAGFHTEICCDFSVVNTVSLLVEKFLDVDICVGIHGAGLSNCIFGRRGVVIVEFQTHHNYGSLLFHKLAHMASGHHIFYDARYAGKMQGKLKNGIILSTSAVQEIVQITKKVYVHSERLQLVERLGVKSNEKTAPIIANGSSTAARGVTCDLLQSAGALPSGAPVGNNKNIIFSVGDRGDGNSFKCESTSVYTTAPPLGYSQVVVVEPKTSTIYLMTSGQGKTAKATHKYVQAVLGLEHYTVHNLQEWLSRVPYVKSKDQAVQKNYLAGVTARNQLTYWVQLNPAMQPYTKESILGPKIQEIPTECNKLLYQQFRHMVFMPEDTVLKDCDKHAILRKRSGANDGLLLTAFI